MLRRPPGYTLFPYPTLFRLERRRRDPEPPLGAAARDHRRGARAGGERAAAPARRVDGRCRRRQPGEPRSEEHTSELQSRQYLVCRPLLAKKKHGGRIRTSIM